MRTNYIFLVQTYKGCKKQQQLNSSSAKKQDSSTMQDPWKKQLTENTAVT